MDVRLVEENETITSRKADLSNLKRYFAMMSDPVFYSLLAVTRNDWFSHPRLKGSTDSPQIFSANGPMIDFWGSLSCLI